MPKQPANPDSTDTAASNKSAAPDAASDKSAKANAAATTRVIRAMKQAGFAIPMHLLLHFPRRHEDWQTKTPVTQLKNGEVAVVQGDIISCQIIPARRRQLLAQLQDDNGDIVGLRFFNVTPGLQRFLESKRRVSARGKVSFKPRAGFEMAHPKFTGGAADNNEDDLRAVYPSAGGLTSKRLQALIRHLLDTLDFTATIPAQVDTFDGSDRTLKQSLEAAHAPAADGASALDSEHIAWRRLRFEELVAHQIALRKRYHYRRHTATALVPADATADATTATTNWREQFCAALPFTLTRGQQTAIDEITRDLSRPLPMRRLLQGDVGSGKTAVAAAAAYLTTLAKRAVAFMAPTEILAEQHYQTLCNLPEKLNLRCELFTGGMSPKRRREAESRLRFGFSSVAVGTHALFQENTTLPNLALAIIDEQHRFGVEQRKALAAKGAGAHQLMMSATPIPRTLALSLYADMDISVIKEKPARRQAIRTVLNSIDKRGELMARLEQHIADGGRAYWVCPLADENASGKTGAGAKDDAMRDVYTVAAEFAAAHPNIGVGVIHGQMKAAEKRDAMERFRAGDHQLLIATTVIEVGVDVPQADVIVIERADRMGLSQLHQLRGRVGRGDAGGICVLMFQPPLAEDTARRLKVIRDSDDGFEIARHDLALRGPGEWLGNRQSGLPSLRVARLGQDEDLAAAARAAAEWMLQNDKRACVRHTRRWLGGLRQFRDSNATPKGGEQGN